MDKMSQSNARKALDQMKMEIANELDANLTSEEKVDGITVNDLVNRAERKMKKLDTE